MASRGHLFAPKENWRDLFKTRLGLTPTGTRSGPGKLIDRFDLANDVVSAVDQPEGTRDGVGGDLAQNRDLIRRSSHLASHPEFVTMPR